MALTEAERQMLLDLRREINELKRERTRLRTGVVTGTGATLKVKLGGDCGGTEIAAIGTSPLEVGDVVSVIEGGGGVSVLGESLTGGQPNLAGGPGIEIVGKNIQVDSSVARKDGAGHVLAVAFPASNDHAANKQYVDIAVALSFGIVPEVASLPTEPLNGYTVLFNGWLCRYDTSPPNPSYPWAVLGGSLYTQDQAVAGITNTSMAAVPGGSMSLSIPTKGIFQVEIGGSAEIIGSKGQLVHSYQVDSGTALTQWGWDLRFEPGGIDALSKDTMIRRYRHTFASAVTLTERARRGSDGETAYLSYRWLEVTPKWIGP